jgi:hypothetical protein
MCDRRGHWDGGGDLAARSAIEQRNTETNERPVVESQLVLHRDWHLEPVTIILDSGWFLSVFS